MTVVCWDGKELVSDSQMNLGDLIQPSPFQKIYLPGENDYWEIRGVKIVAFGIAGDAFSIEYVKEKLQQGIDHKTRFEENKDLGFHAILINENGEAFVWRYVKNSDRNRERVELLPMLPPVAIGSGMEFALGCMAIGKSARVGVKAACRLDVSCGGAIQHFLFEGKPAIPSKRPVPPAKPEEEKPVEPASEQTPSKDVPVDAPPAQVAAA